MSQTKAQTMSAEYDVQQAVSSAAHSAGATIRDATDRLQTRAAEVGEQVSRRAEHAVRDLGDHVQAQPIASVAVAAGIGFIAGLLLGRR